MNQEQLEAEMQIAPKEMQIEFASALSGYIMLGIAHTKRIGKNEFSIDATLPMLDMIKRAIDGKLRVVEINTATELMAESLKNGVFGNKTESVKVEL